MFALVVVLPPSSCCFPFLFCWHFCSRTIQLFINSNIEYHSTLTRFERRTGDLTGDGWQSSEFGLGVANELAVVVLKLERSLEGSAEFY